MLEGCCGLTSVTLPDSLTSLDFRALCNCSGLTSLTLPSTLTRLWPNAFRNHRLTYLSVPYNFSDVDIKTALGGDVDTVNIFIRPPVPAAFTVWVVGGSRNRDNWELTTLRNSVNILKLIVAFAVERRQPDWGKVEIKRVSSSFIRYW